ncbi:hypothetical protein OG455_38185 [Kitasatospora sp. NBC_01287]|uniref:hypothetical protein n=1 Tax=Kitasatospora sp. NBC_01287 TaxID=2903573 RepID=UPI00225A33B8|nr:hypothetical protein [Kitasatospora sp. NBC_01287]MCX4751267.1 hypothetical protein [Kitasatospora sp. NBC_01287]
MPASENNAQPDIVVGRHREYGIVADCLHEIPTSDWMLRRLGFRQVADQQSLYALVEPDRQGQDRTRMAITTLRRAGFRVGNDPEFEPAPDEPAARDRDRAHPAEPDVAFAEHPRLGVVAATASTMNAVDRGGPILEEHGWKFDHQLDIYLLPDGVERGGALDRVAQATTALHRAGDLQVAVHPQLASAVVARRSPPPVATSRSERTQGFVPHALPRTAAALAASPARSGMPSKAPAAAPQIAAPPARPVDPRIAFSRPR